MVSINFVVLVIFWTVLVFIRFWGNWCYHCSKRERAECWFGPFFFLILQTSILTITFSSNDTGVMKSEGVTLGPGKKNRSVFVVSSELTLGL